MRTLRFIVKNQTIKQDPNCDFSGLVPGSEGYLQAEFVLSPEWKNMAVVASFWSNMGTEYPPQILGNTRTCAIPVDALKKKIFKVQLIGKDEHGTRLITNKVAVSQNGGN